MATTLPPATPPVRETQKPQRSLSRAKMVGWYDPRQLLRTANEVAISTILGRHADRRLVQALGPEKIPPYDYTMEFKQSHAQDGAVMGEMAQREEIWIDYVSDVGDGWNPTYAVAHYLAQKELNIDGPQQPLPRGQILVLGGDEVYPTANSEEYANRLEHPYGAALQNDDNTEARPHIFAIPGNHDWYDSLASFTRIFCDKSYFPLFDEDEPTDPFQPGLWHTPQQRSYFALKLPQRYWLIAIDLQLSSDLDVQQTEYFREIARKQMAVGDRIILCCAEPYWVFREMYAEVDPSYHETRLGRDYLETKIFKEQKIVAYLAGDLHHYFSVFDPQNGVVKITAGGGGAFLHPTHGHIAKAFAPRSEPVKRRASKTPKPVYQRCFYPSVAESRILGFGNLTFLLKNWKFGMATALTYFLAAWSVLAFFREEIITQLETPNLDLVTWLNLIATETLYVGLKTPVAALWGILIVAGFLLFTETHSRWYRVIAGLSHGLSHVIACLLISWFAHRLVTYHLSDWIRSFSGGNVRLCNLVLSALFIVVFAWILGSIIMGLYLFISLNVFGRHSNEAFSSLAQQDWKNFLRLHIAKDGSLTIYPIGIRRVPRKWRAAKASDQTVSAFVSDDPKAIGPELIEAPIRLLAKP